MHRVKYDQSVKLAFLYHVLYDAPFQMKIWNMTITVISLPLEHFIFKGTIKNLLLMPTDSSCQFRGQKYFNIALVLQAE